MSVFAEPLAQARAAHRRSVKWALIDGKRDDGIEREFAAALDLIEQRAEEMEAENAAMKDSAYYRQFAERIQAAEEYTAELEHRVDRTIRERDNAVWLVDQMEDRLRDGAARGETPEVRAWCSQALFQAGPEGYSKMNKRQVDPNTGHWCEGLQELCAHCSSSAVLSAREEATAVSESCPRGGTHAWVGHPGGRCIKCGASAREEAQT